MGPYRAMIRSRCSQVLVAESRMRSRAARDDLDDLDAEAPVDGVSGSRRERAAAAGDAEIGASEPALAHELGDDAARGVVEGYGEAEPDPRHSGVDADEAATAVEEGAAGVPRVQGGVGLDDVLDDAAGRAGARGKRAAE